MVSKDTNRFAVDNAMIFRRRSSKESRIVRALDNRSIALVGIMGCGKSAIGKITARKLGLKFYDTDVEIEKAAGRSVADIFSEFGEPEFRRLEVRVIERLMDGKPCMLALGGGAFLNESTQSVIKEKGVSVWMKADLELLLARVSRKPGKRPLLATGDPRKKLEELLEVREPIYAKADIMINPGDVSKNVSRNALIDALFDHLVSEEAQSDG